MEAITAIIIVYVQNNTLIYFSNSPIKAQDTLVALSLVSMNRLRNWKKYAEN